MRVKNKVDYNLLQVFLVIYQQRSLSQAAKQLGYTDSAVSKMLAKLRESFDDALFIRHAKGLEPTAFSHWFVPQLEPKLAELTHLLDTALDKSQQTARTVTISLTSTDVELFGSELYNQLEERFPKVRFDIVHWDSNTLDQITAQEVDFAVAPTMESASKLCYQSHLFFSAARLIFPSFVELDNWDETFEYNTLKIMVQGWNSNDRPVARKLETYGIYVNGEEMASLDSLIYGNSLMLERSLTRPCALSVFDYQVSPFQTKINPEIQVVSPLTHGNYSYEPSVEFSLYEYAGARQIPFYNEVKQIIKSTLCSD